MAYQPHALTNFTYIGTGLVTAVTFAIASATAVNISAGTGLIADFTADPTLPSIEYFDWPETELVITDVASKAFTDVYVDNSGGPGFTFFQQSTQGGFSFETFDTAIPLCRVEHPGATITSVSSRGWPAYGAQPAIRELLKVIGPVSLEGNVFAAAASDLSLFKSAGQGFRMSAGLDLDAGVPFRVPQPELDPVTFSHLFSDGTPPFTTATLIPGLTQIDPSVFDDLSGTLAVIPPPKCQIMTIFLEIGSNDVGVVYGRTIYNTMSEAEVGILIEPGNVYSAFTERVTRCDLIVRSGTTDISSAADAKFIARPQGLGIKR